MLLPKKLETDEAELLLPDEGEFSRLSVSRHCRSSISSVCSESVKGGCKVERQKTGGKNHESTQKGADKKRKRQKERGMREGNEWTKKM